MQGGLVELPKWVTTEGVFAAAGAIWLVLIGFTPIPESVPLGLPIPGFTDINITPGLLIGVALVPAIIKSFNVGQTPFIANVKRDDKAPDA